MVGSRQCCEDWSLHPVQKWLALVCNISAGYAIIWTCEWRALRHIVSGWHAALMADMENTLSNLLDIAGTAQLALTCACRSSTT